MTKYCFHKMHKIGFRERELKVSMTFQPLLARVVLSMSCATPKKSFTIEKCWNCVKESAFSCLGHGPMFRQANATQCQLYELFATTEGTRSFGKDNLARKLRFVVRSNFLGAMSVLGPHGLSYQVRLRIFRKITITTVQA